MKKTLPQSRHKTMKKNNMIKSTKKKETMKNEIMLNHYDNQSHGYIKISEYDLKYNQKQTIDCHYLLFF